MKQITFTYLLKIAMTLLIGSFPVFTFGQLSVDMSSTDNTNCDGFECDYNGPSILINELMISPSAGDGSLYAGLASQAGEWIELYNPNICDSVDISCYYLGNNANDSDPYPGGYVIPPGTVIPPSGFALIRGVNAPPVPAELLMENGGNVRELIVDGDGVCIGGGSRLWFPNAGGWFAFYDNNGVPQDAVSWASQANTNQNPCTPALTGCNFAGALPNYDGFPNDRKNYILDESAANFQGQSIRRIPDGGAWSGPGNSTMADCNDACIDVQVSICNGTATAEPQGGVAPYTYLWDDVQQQVTQTAERLCAGEYCVLITDALGDTVQQCVIVENASYAIDVNDGFCEGETYMLPNDSVVDEAGTYNILLQTPTGCDSSITVELETYPIYADTLDAEICDNQTYTLPDGNEVSATGIYNVVYQTIHGCDSTFTVNLTVLPPIEIPQSIEVCPGTTVELPDGTEVEDPGVYDVLISGGTNCDTLYIVDVQHYPEIEVDFDTFSDISCFGENDGFVSLDITGGTAPYAVTWSDGQDHGISASDLPPGNYSAEITDDNGCEAEISFEITEPAEVEISATADTLICLGTDAELTAQATGGTGDFTYHWNHSAETTANSTVSPGEDTSYTVYATDENGCTTETITLGVNVISMDDDQLQVTAGNPVCSGGETTVEAFYDGEHPPYSYEWSDGLPHGPGPHVVAPDESTTYTVTVSDDCGNEVTGQVTATIWPLPNISLDAVNDISCYAENDGNAEITVSDGTPDFTFTWSDGLNHGANASDLPPGNYTVQVSDANGCASEASFDISEPMAVELSATADTLICFGTEAELVAVASGGIGDFTYHWSHTTSTAANSTVSPDENTSYTVYATDENGCTTETIALDVSVISMEDDQLQVTAGNPVCSGGETTVEAFYDGEHPPYSYEWSDGLPNGPGPHAVNLNETTTYTVTVSDDCGNQATGDVEVIIHPLPQISLVDFNNVQCFDANDGSATVSANDGTPGYAYIWSDGLDHDATATDLGPGNYSVTLVDSEGCSDSLSFDITEPDPLSISLSGDSLSCPAEAVELQTEVTGGIGNITYNWNEGLADAPDQTVLPLESTTYSVFATDENGCSTATVSWDVEVITMDSNLLETSNGGPVCPGDETSVGASYSGQHPPYDYAWSPDLPTGPGPHTVIPEGPEVYVVTVSDVCNNQVQDTVHVDAHDVPVIDLPDILGNGCTDLEVLYTETLNDPETHTYVWTVNDQQVYHGNTFHQVFSTPDIHSVHLSITNFNGCNTSSDFPAIVIALPSPTAGFSANPWEAGINDPEIEFSDESTGEIETWEWTFGDGDNSAFQHPIHTYSDTGTYVVQLVIENDFGCRDSLTQHVVINPEYNVVVPTAFTPTGNNSGYYDPTDTSNDIFYAFADYVEEFRMSIFNRWGELIFESLDINYGWNGFYRDEPCPQDVYVYKIEFKFSDGEEITRVGDLTLFR